MYIHNTNCIKIDVLIIVIPKLSRKGNLNSLLKWKRFNCVTYVWLIVRRYLITNIDFVFSTQEQREYKDDIGYDLDYTLMKFSSIFIILYDVFTVITGSFAGNVLEYHIFEIHIMNGILEIIQVTLQMVFLHNLKSKVNICVWNNLEYCKK